MTPDLKQAMRRFVERTDLALVLDHVGRAGNGFFLCVFDTHPEVLACHWVHYVYSYIVTEFGEADVLDARAAHDFIIEKSYFKYVLGEPDDEMRAMMHRFGADPDTPLDREAGRAAFADFVLSRQTVTRRELVLAAYFAYGTAAGRDLSRVRRVMVADAVSLRTQKVMDGFEGTAAHAAMRDFPDARLVSLVRDPRAQFASNRHQFVNANGNMYNVHPGGVLSRLGRLLSLDITPDDATYLYWLAYGAATARTIYRLKRTYAERSVTVRNEDLNLDFLPTLQSLCDWLGVAVDPAWSAGDWQPTSVGRPWKGTGAYNSNYQRHVHGPLKNDPLQVALKAAGPNEYVTKRWMTRLAAHEIRLLEDLFRDEMRDLGYEPLPGGGRLSPGRFLALAARPFLGELPTRAWIAEGRALGRAEVLDRLHYALVFPLFSLVSRLQFARLRLTGFFDNALPATPADDRRAKP